MPAVKNYFQYFPKVDFLGRQVVDLTRRATFLKDIKDDYRLVGFYKVKPGETPWGLAHDFYGSEEYDWIIFGLNDIVNPLFDWCLSQVELDRLISLKYPGETRYDIHHYVFEDRIYYEPVIFEDRWRPNSPYYDLDVVIPTIVSKEEADSEDNLLDKPSVPFRFQIVQRNNHYEWSQSLTALQVGDYVIPSGANQNGFKYRVTTGGSLASAVEPEWPVTGSTTIEPSGTLVQLVLDGRVNYSGADEPIWSGTVGSTVEDGNMIWENIGPYAHPESVFVTNQEHEEIENEKKRIIKVLRPRYLTAIVSEFDKTMRGVLRR